MSPNAVSCQVMLAQAVREVEENRSGFVAIIIIFITISHVFCFNGIMHPKRVLFAVFVQHELNLGPLCCATSTWWLRRIATPFLRIYFFVNHLNIFLKIIFARRMLGAFEPICFPSCWDDWAMLFSPSIWNPKGDSIHKYATNTHRRFLGGRDWRIVLCPLPKSSTSKVSPLLFVFPSFHVKLLIFFHIWKRNNRWTTNEELFLLRTLISVF